MKNREKIGKVESILKREGFNNQDYCISLQGPSVIFTMGGWEKLNKDIKSEIEELIKVI